VDERLQAYRFDAVLQPAVILDDRCRRALVTRRVNVADARKRAEHHFLMSDRTPIMALLRTEPEALARKHQNASLAKRNNLVRLRRFGWRTVRRLAMKGQRDHVVRLRCGWQASAGDVIDEQSRKSLCRLLSAPILHQGTLQKHKELFPVRRQGEALKTFIWR